MTQDTDNHQQSSSLFSTTQDDQAKKLNNLIARAMRLLGQRDHGEAELRRKLLTPPQPFSRPSSYKARQNPDSRRQAVPKEVEEIDPDQVEEVIAYCYQHSWLDDAKFAGRYISGRSNRGLGAQRIRSELTQKGVDKEVIAQALEECEVDWCSKAYELATHKFGQPLPTDWKEKSKVLRYLLYRGFFQEEIQSIYRDFED